MRIIEQTWSADPDVPTIDASPDAAPSQRLEVGGRRQLE